jgi:hypothetical protein
MIDDMDAYTEQLRVALADAVREIDSHNAEYKYVTPTEKLEEWRRLSSPDGEGMPAILARLDAVGADPGHPHHQVAREALEQKMDGVSAVRRATRNLLAAAKTAADAPHAFVVGKFERGERGHQMPEETCVVCGRDPRNSVHHDAPRGVVAGKFRPGALLEEVGERLAELVQMLAEKVGAVGVRRLVVSQELGLRLGVTPETPVSLMTPCGVVQVFADRDVKKEITKGLLDALNLSMNMVGTHVTATIEGMPGLSVMIKVEAARELHVGLGALLGQELPPDDERAASRPHQLADVLRLVEESEAARDRWVAERARAGVAGEPPTLSVLCSRLREVLGIPRRSTQMQVTPPG